MHNVHIVADDKTDSEQSGALEQQFRLMRTALVGWFRRRIGDASEAEDLVQESFMRIARREREGDVAHFEGYLYRTAQSVLFDRQRRRKARLADAHLPLLPDHDAAEESDALRALLAREKLQRVTAVLNTMPERTRSIFILCRLDGMRYAEVATRYSISVSAVQKHMLRAIETLLRDGEDEA